MEERLRYLADSNRRTRFCRPLTKPLIQGTKRQCRCFSRAKIGTFLLTAKKEDSFLI